jgi:hypothetical protein
MQPLPWSGAVQSTFIRSLESAEVAATAWLHLWLKFKLKFHMKTLIYSVRELEERIILALFIGDESLKKWYGESFNIFFIPKGFFLQSNNLMRRPL